jgi:tRNA dimethylallyltransferase
MKQTVIAVVGPTAVGKTALSIQLAKTLNGEVISGDAMQVYKGMDIGTAKVQEKEMQGIPHHMIDIKNPDEPFSVADFKAHVQTYIDEIGERNRTPVIAGGSGLYIQATLFDYQFPKQQRDQSITNRLEMRVKTEGAEALYNELQRIDPEQAKKIHPNNYRRVIRALEIYETTGLTMSEYQSRQSQTPIYDAILIGLHMDREILYEQINKRVDLMIENGLLQEVKWLYDQGYKDAQSMKAIGYKELIPYIEEKQTWDECIELLKRNSRRYAKRQLTWFRNKLDHVKWYNIHPETAKKQFSFIAKEVEGILKRK